LSAGDVAAFLEQHGRSAAEAHAVAAAADGSLQRALESLAGDLVQGRESAEQALARAAASEDPRRRIDGAKDLLVKTSSAAGDREQLAIYLRSMSSILRDTALVSLDPEAPGLANADRRETLSRLARTYRGERVLRAFNAVDRALAALDRNAGVKIVADWLMLQL
jgi:hypothetical protein